jgi:hypothetical protein
MEMQQVLERLLAGQARMQEDIKSAHEEIKSTINAFQKKMDACIENIKDARKERTSFHGQTEVNSQKTVPDPEMMQSTEKHQETPTENGTMMQVKGLRKQHRVQYLATDSRRTKRMIPGELMDLEESQMSPAGRCLPCKSGMAKKEPHQKNLDRSKL